MTTGNRQPIFVDQRTSGELADARAEIDRLRSTLAEIHAETLVPDGGPTGDDIDDVWPSLMKIHELSKPTTNKDT